jgi:peptide/nickel transport system substrate-binding protein/glutathione transport system substrate-binding protein
MDRRYAVNALIQDALNGRINRRELMKRAAALGVAVPGVIALGVPRGEVAAQEASPTPKTGGNLTTLTIGDPKSLDIQVSQLAQLRQMIGSMYDRLVYHDLSDYSLKPQLAKEWTWTDPTTLDVPLVEGVTFHGGQSFTADDVKFTVDRILNPDTGSSLASQLSAIDSVEVVDPSHVRFHLKHAWPALIENLTAIYIYSKSATDESIRTKPNGTGPFQFVEWRQNDHIRLKKNPKYWQEGLPYLDQIDFKPISEEETRISMLDTKAADVMFSLELKDIDRIKSTKGLAVLQSPFEDRGDIMYMNNARAPLSDQNLRLAVASTVDRATFIKQFLAGFGNVNTSPWDKSEWAYNPINDNAFPYDLDKAKQMLEAGGYPGGKDKSGKQLVLNLIYPTGYPEWNQGSVMIQSSFQEIGVQVKVEELEPTVWADRLINTGDFDFSWDFHGGHIIDPAATLSYAYFYPPVSTNLCRYKDDQMAKLIEEGGTTTGQDKRQPFYWQFQERWNQIMPGIIVGQRVIADAARDDVKGFTADPLFFEDFRHAWLDR